MLGISAHLVNIESSKSRCRHDPVPGRPRQLIPTRKPEQAASRVSTMQPTLEQELDKVSAVELFPSEFVASAARSAT